MPDYVVYALVAIAVVIAVIGGLFIYSYCVVEAFAQRCLALMPPMQLMAPCDIAVKHARQHGLVSRTKNIVDDVNLLAIILPTLEKDGEVKGFEKIPDEHCQCIRVYCRSHGQGRIAEKKHQFKPPEWLPQPI